MTSMTRLDAQLQATRSQLANGKAEIDRMSRLLRKNASAKRDAADGHAVGSGMATSLAPLEAKTDPTAAETTGTTMKAEETDGGRATGNAQEIRASIATAAATSRTSGAPEGAPVAPASKRPAASHAGGAKSKRRRRSTLQYIGTGAAGSAKEGGDSVVSAEKKQEQEEKEEGGVRPPASPTHPVFAKFEQVTKGVAPSAIARVVDTAREAGVAADKIVACENVIETAAAAAAVAAAAAAVETGDVSEDSDVGGGGGGKFDGDEGGLKAEGRIARAAAATAAAAAADEEKAARMDLEALVEARTGATRILMKTPLELMLAAMEVNASTNIIVYCVLGTPASTRSSPSRRQWGVRTVLCIVS